MSENPLTVINNPDVALARVAKQQSALSRLFQLKPSTLELVSKSTQQEGAIPGQFRDTATNEHFKEMRAVILFEPVEQRELYQKGAFSRDSKLCFSLDNFQPHQAARDPKAALCEFCDYGDKNWKAYREAKKAGVKGDQLSALVPPCKKYWHLFLANRGTKMPYYFNAKGKSVTAFEGAMQNIARLMHVMIQNINLQNRQIAEANAKVPEGQTLQSLIPLPTSVGDVIWQISFTMYAHQPEKGGQWVLGMKDFAVMKPEDYKEFGSIIEKIKDAREARALQSQVDSENEAAAADAAKVEASAAEPAPTSAAAKNKQIVI